MRLVRVDCARNVHRWYVVGVQATLLDAWAVVCGWGSLRSGYERWRCIPCEDETHARQLAERIARRKIRRGYRFSGGVRMDGAGKISVPLCQCKIGGMPGTRVRLWWVA